ncbi:hypothetical protein B0D71_28155 [Pseudomonas laurylsulfativorans]|uniref:Uncharacterized protein n=1 Tax=Pseudomonas laurylsulfativorans TaxID=1943631 RepID=A0A2S3VH21_9PSED|nr:hypothetical protein B0D71_28155 [Pseudomonas laurylsulfativorans]
MIDFTVVRGFLWRGGLPPLGCEAALNPVASFRQLNCAEQFCDCYAVERGQAPSPQKLSSHRFLGVPRGDQPSSSHQRSGLPSAGQKRICSIGETSQRWTFSRA